MNKLEFIIPDPMNMEGNIRRKLKFSEETLIKDHPILFSTSMVEAIDADRKKATRRTTGLEVINQTPDGYVLDYCGLDSRGKQVVRFAKKGTPVIQPFIKCRYGKVGDLLWVRETFRYCQPFGPESLCYEYKNGQHSSIEVATEKTYKIGDYERWRPSIHMPKDAARIWLRITDIRVERLWKISSSEAVKEGIQALLMSRMQLALMGQLYRDYRLEPAPFNDGVHAKKSFETLWISINGFRSWALNPWVWVVEFEKVEHPALSTRGRTTNFLEAYSEANEKRAVGIEECNEE